MHQNTLDERRLTVGPADAGERLDRLLARHFGDLSRSRFRILIGEGGVATDGRTIVDPNYRVKPGEVVAVSLPQPVPAEPQAQAIPLAVVYEDEHLIVIDKPAGLVVHPAAGNWDGTLVNALIAHCGASLSGIGGVRRPGIVHRLDKDTSGLLVVAKTDRAHAGLAAQFAAHGRDGLLARSYIAFVWGRPARAKGLIETMLGRKRTDRRKMAVLSTGGKAARTRYEVVASAPDAGEAVASRLRLMLETGRTHQIRVHMAHIGHPILGDVTYGKGFASRIKRISGPAQDVLAGLKRQALHAESLGFQHPFTGERLVFASSLPADLERLAGALGLAAGTDLQQGTLRIDTRNRA